MLGSLLRRNSYQAPDLLESKLFNEDTFYPAFLKDLNKCHSELIIECPFITHRRLNYLLPALQKLKARKVRVVINTRDPHEHDEERWRDETHRALATLQRGGIQVLYTSGHHRKVIILDRSTCTRAHLTYFPRIVVVR